MTKQENQDFEHNRENCHFTKRMEEIHSGKYSYKIPREYEDPIGGYILGIPTGGLIGMLGGLAYSWATGESEGLGIAGFLAGLPIGGIFGRAWVAYNNMMYKEEREYMFRQIQARKENEKAEREKNTNVGRKN